MAIVERQQVAVEILTVHGWYKGAVTIPAGGRLLDYLNTKPEMIAITNVVDPSGAPRGFMAINTAQVLAIRPQPKP